MSDRARGRAAVIASWKQIFDSGVGVRLRLSDLHRTQDALLAVHVVYEHVALSGQQGPPGRVIATNIYQLIDGSWRMVLHHASPTPAKKGENGAVNGAVPSQRRRLH
jgi:hypothetical protein